MPERSVAALARRWWAGELGAAGVALMAVLAPAELLYRVGVAARNRAFGLHVLHAHRAAIPVVSIGNVAVGGTGKTPFAQHIARALRARGARPAILHGGYGDDEPALHRHWSPDIPVIVERDRVRGVQLARAAGADVAVLDDGFQHRRLWRDLDIVLVAAERWQQHQRMLPRGPWREPRSALRRADLIVVTRKTATTADAAAARAELQRLTGAPVIVAHLDAEEWTRDGVAAAPPSEPALAVAALAEPELFAASARAAGAEIKALTTFPDHHRYSPDDAHQLLQRAAGAPIVTTEKDWIKLHVLLPGERVWVLRQHVRIAEGAGILDARLDAFAVSSREAERRRS